MADRPKQSGLSQRRRRRSSRGAVLVVVIVCLAIVTAVFVSIVKMAAAERRATRTGQWRMQATWLAESALERAASRLADDDAYAGETWTVTAKELDSAEPGSVEIEIRAIPGRPDRRLVRVRADYPDHSEHRARQSKQVTVQIPAATDAAGGTEDTIPVEEEP